MDDKNQTELELTEKRWKLSEIRDGRNLGILAENAVEAIQIARDIGFERQEIRVLTRREDVHAMKSPTIILAGGYEMRIDLLDMMFWMDTTPGVIKIPLEEIDLDQ